MSHVAKYVSKALFVGGFAVFIYCIAVAATGGIEAAKNPAMLIGWVMIALGVVGHLLSAPSNTFWGKRGARIIAVGWGMLAVGIILESHPAIGTVLTTAGFVLFGIGVLLSIPEFR